MASTFACATAAIGSAIAAAVTATVAVVGGAPVLLVAAVVLGGYILAATAIDMVDNTYQLKERAAAATR